MHRETGLNSCQRLVVVFFKGDLWSLNASQHATGLPSKSENLDSNRILTPKQTHYKARILLPDPYLQGLPYARHCVEICSFNAFNNSRGKDYYYYPPKFRLSKSHNLPNILQLIGQDKR